MRFRTDSPNSGGMRRLAAARTVYSVIYPIDGARTRTETATGWQGAWRRQLARGRKPAHRRFPTRSPGRQGGRGPGAAEPGVWCQVRGRGPAATATGPASVLSGARVRGAVLTAGARVCAARIRRGRRSSYLGAL